jgi:DNA recombination-dependent growth factor C
MTLEEVRIAMNRWWATIDADAQARKDSMSALFALFDYYGALPEDERQSAQIVLTEWLYSDDAAQRYDAQATIERYRIGSALPSLRARAAALAPATAPEGRFELDKIIRTIALLEHPNP